MPIHEVSAPATAAPEHTMSPEGAARLAALTPDQKQVPTEEPDRPSGREPGPKLVKDADGNTADTATGEYKPAEQPLQPPGERPVDLDILEAIPEAFVPEKYAEAAAAYRIDAANIAKDAGIPAPEMGALYQFITSRVAADLGRAEHDAILDQGQQAGASLRNPDETRNRLLSRYGKDTAEAIIRAAGFEFAKLPDSVKAWIDGPNEYGDRIGNHPQVVVGLALRAFAKLSPAAAQEELGRLRQSSGYLNGDPLTRDKVAMLSYVAAGGTKLETRAAQAISTDGKVGRTFSTNGQDVPARLGAQTAAEALAELQALTQQLTDQRGPLSSDPKRRKAALQRRADLMAQLSGGA